MKGLDMPWVMLLLLSQPWRVEIWQQRLSWSNCTSAQLCCVRLQLTNKQPFDLK